MSRLALLAGIVVVLGVLATPALAQAPQKLAVFLYVDTVNGTRPVGAKPRPIGCTQTNTFKRGEQVVFRTWGTEATTGAILSTENVKYAYVKLAGQPNMKLNWGAHGATTNRVWFWTTPWIVPADYPLGALTARIVFKTERRQVRALRLRHDHHSGRREEEEAVTEEKRGSLMSAGTRTRRIGRRVATVLVAAAAVLALQSVAAADPTVIPAPVVPGAPPVPGAITDPGKPSETMKTLKTAPDVAVAGTSMTLSGSGLAAAKDVTIVWMTANVRYILDPKPDSVDYLGRKVDKIGVVLATAQTNASGAFSVSVKAPKDFGGIHDIFAVVDGMQVAKGGFLLERQVSISPKRGPVGTPITISIVGMGSPTYESVGAVLYDNRYAGAVSANTTRGVTSFKIRAAGKVGPALDRVRGLEPHGPVPQHGAVAGPMDGQPPAEVHGDEGRRPAGSGRRAGCRRQADDRRAYDRDRRRRRVGLHGARQHRLREGEDPVEGQRLGQRPHAECAGRPPVDVGRRKPRELHRSVLEVHLPADRAFDHGRRRLGLGPRSRSPTGSAAGTRSRSSRPGT